MATIPKSELFELCSHAFKRAGYTDDKAIETICHHLLQNELSGKRSHGILRVKWSVNYIQEHGLPTGKPELAVDCSGLGIVDGKNNLGLVAAEYAAHCAINKAKEHGIAFVGARNHFGITGTMNYYNRLFVESGLIGIAGCNSLAQVCHPDGFDPVLGTTPISFGFPSQKTPCIVDVTTAEWAYGKLMEMHKAGKEMPEGAIIDKDGNPSVNFKDALGGAMLPMQGIKGFSIGLAIEILSGALIGAKSGRDAVKDSDGIFFIALNPDILVGQKQFEEHVEMLLQEIKSSRHSDAVAEILIPGERSERSYNALKDSDTIEILDTVYNDLKELAA